MMDNCIENVGAESISALEWKYTFKIQRVEMDSQRAEMDSAPTGNKLMYETVGADSISAREPKIQYKHNRR